MKLFNEFLKDESGATAIEYGLIAALVSVAAIGALQAMGGSLTTMFTGVRETLGDVTPATPGDTSNDTPPPDNG